MEDEALKYLYDIKEAASAIFRFVQNKTFEDLHEKICCAVGLSENLRSLEKP